MATQAPTCEANVRTTEAVTGHMVGTCCAGFIGLHLTDELMADAPTAVGIGSFVPNRR